MNLKSVCLLLLSLCHAATAAALGLGDLTLHSYLGQPFHASVRIVGADAKLDADCFRIAPAENAAAAPPQRAQFSLERSGAQAVLHIRSPIGVNDPVAQFALVADCEVRVKRDYVVLLDPPETATLAIGRSLSPPAPAEAPAAPAAASAPARAQPARPAPRPRAKPAPAPAPARTVATPAPDFAPAAPTAPRLVLSGRNHTGAGGLALRLDTTLPEPGRALPEGLTATELSDENTALTRKLAYLEAQLVELQRRNAALEARRVARENGTQAPAPRRNPWPLYLLALGAVLGTWLLVWWLRRRRLDAVDTDSWRTVEPEDTVEPDTWSRAPATPPIAPKPVAEPPTVAAAPEAEARRVEPGFGLSPTMDQGTEVKEDILDQAEVYVAHGHGDIAISLLQEHLRDAPAESPVPWLLLLDLLHREGDEAAYAAASAECRRHFNVKLGDHPISRDREDDRGLETYPHLMERLVELWGSPDLEAFFNDLIYDKRGGTRVGFEPGAYRDILMLRSIAQVRPAGR